VSTAHLRNSTVGFANLPANEFLHFYVFARFGNQLDDQIIYSFAALEDIFLLEQTVFLVEALELALDYLPIMWAGFRFLTCSA